MGKNLIVPEKSREVDIWMGYIDSLAGRIGEQYRAAKSDEDLDRIQGGLYTAKERKLILQAFAKMDAMKPDLQTSGGGDPEFYAQLLEYYAGTCSRLGMELVYLGESQKAREAYNRAFSVTTNRETLFKLWNEYARTLMNVKANAEAAEIINMLMRQELPNSLR